MLDTGDCLIVDALAPHRQIDWPKDGVVHMDHEPWRATCSELQTSSRVLIAPAGT